MATTRFMKRHTGKGETIAYTMARSFGYGANPDKTLEGKLISCYECDWRSADAEFLLSKAKYRAVTGREQKGDEDVLFYQIRQSFVVGEITPEEANRLAYDTAMRWTKGRHAFFVTTHIDRPHVHCHIYYNSTSLDCTRKFRDFIGSVRSVRRLSDRICLENGLSIVEHPHLPSRGKFQNYGQWQEAKGQRLPSFQERLRRQIDTCLAAKPGSFDDFLRGMTAAGFDVKHGRGGVVSFRNPAFGQERFTRLRADTLGAGYGQEDVQAIIAGRAPLPKERRALKPFALVVDIQAKMRQGKGPAYEQWAKVFNLKQMAAALQYLQENGLAEYGQLAERAAKATDRFHTLEWQMRGIDDDLKTNGELRAAMVDYAKTRPVFDGYKAAKYSNQFLAEHEVDIALHRAARATFTRLLDGGKLPRMDALKQRYDKLAAERRVAHREYKTAKQDMREAMTAKANIDRLLAVTGPGGEREKER